MNAPLGTVIFFVKSLESQVLSEDGTFDLDAVRMYFKFIFSCLMLVQTFANDLVDLRQIKEGQFTLQSDIFDPNTIIQLVCDIFSPQADAKGVKIDWNVQESIIERTQKTLPMLSGDVRRF